ncbi:hypothetical protein [Ammoniphilus sp. CFH 90114]|uniref:DUF3846 domain-containing protein n=1 Tax=Ammoniphilus sp. CFH 90114 TaxID=2493665 RepID=UPI00100E5778|nr:hypothetical protein [Ammoniphilus sp. CFH 90114]RXT15253.1 hypothetical protein EIZ39_03310 [Ammoniphilus sp. CFH 90114]
MITIVLKQPEQPPTIYHINAIEELEEKLEGEFEVAFDDQLEGISILVNEEVRGLKPHNFTIETDGSHDWVYGTAIFTRIEEGSLQSLTEEQINTIKEYFSKTREYK